jgi:glycosyltransferase involved in cell wall biosynthesis
VQIEKFAFENIVILAGILQQYIYLRNMRILMVLDHEFPPDIRVENEIDSLNRAGHEIHLACFTRKGKATYEKTKGCIIHRKPVSVFIFKSSVACLSLPFYFGYWRKFIREILKYQSFDAIHIHDLPLAQIGYEARRAFDIRLILDLHENWPAFVEAAEHTNTLAGKILSPVKPWERYEKQMVGKADVVIAVVEEMKNRLVFAGASEEKIVVVPNTIRLGEYHESNQIPDPGYMTLLYCGGIDNQRGLQIAMEGMSKIVQELPNARFWLVGKGSYEETLKKRVEQLKISDNVVFWGWQKPENMFALIQQSDIAIIPYIRTIQTDCSSPNKLFQYMYARKPVLASNCTSIKRILDETGSGMCYEHDSPDDFAAKALGLIKDNLERNRMAENGGKYAMEKYNWDLTVDKLIKIYS